MCLDAWIRKCWRTAVVPKWPGDCYNHPGREKWCLRCPFLSLNKDRKLSGSMENRLLDSEVTKFGHKSGYTGIWEVAGRGGEDARVVKLCQLSHHMIRKTESQTENDLPKVIERACSRCQFSKRAIWGLLLVWPPFSHNDLFTMTRFKANLRWARGRRCL